MLGSWSSSSGHSVDKDHKVLQMSILRRLRIGLFAPRCFRSSKRTVIFFLKEKHLSYAGGLGGTPELLAAISRFFNHFFSPKIPVRPEHVVTGPGCSAVLDTLINDICDDGDGLLVSAPMWGT